MKAMKDSGIDWVGIIPDSWQVVPFRSYAEMRREKNKGEKTRELLALSFALGVTLYRDKVYNMDRVKEDYEDYQIVYENDLVLSPNDIIKGSVYVSKYYGCISPMYLVFSARDKKCHHLPYLSYLLRTQEAGRKFFFIARGLIGDILENGKYVTRRMSVSKQDLLSFKVLLPSFAEQQRIAEFLDGKCAEVDEMIALQEQIIEELKAYKQSVITEAVTKGLKPDVPMKDSGIEWIDTIPCHWIVRKMKSLIDLKSGSNLTSEQISEKEDGYPVYGGNGLRGTYSEYSNEGDYVLIGRQGALCGNINYASGKFWVTEHALVCYPKEVLDIRWLGESLRTMNLNQYSLSAAQPGLSAERIKNLYMIVPPTTEQQAIADYLDEKCADIDSLIQTKQSKIDSLKEYKKSIIYEYVTGKREVE